MKLELVSFKICPYVQRSIITLLHKKVPFTLTHIDPGAPPEWFKEISPLGKVPLLKVDETDILFESAVINEFIDESTPGRLLPEAPLPRAQARAWIEYASACTADMTAMAMAGDEAAFKEKEEILLKRLGRLEAPLAAGPFFLGDSLSLVDCAFAPLLMRLAIIHQGCGAGDLTALPRAHAWSARLAELPEVRDSVAPELPRLYTGFLIKRNGFLGQRLKAGLKG